MIWLWVVCLALCLTLVLTDNTQEIVNFRNRRQAIHNRRKVLNRMHQSNCFFNRL